MNKRNGSFDENKHWGKMFLHKYENLIAVSLFRMQNKYIFRVSDRIFY